MHRRITTTPDYKIQGKTINLGSKLKQHQFVLFNFILSKNN